MDLPLPDYLANSKVAYDGKRFKVVTTHQVGHSGKQRLREIVVHPGAVLILPLLSDGRVVMIKNFRVSVNKYLWELPAGTLEIGEPPLECAKRELIEETGYEGGEFIFLTDYFTSPGMCNERMYTYVAKNLTLKQQQLEDGEYIEVSLLTWDEINAYIDSGEIEDAKTLLTLLLWQKNHSTQRP